MMEAVNNTTISITGYGDKQFFDLLRLTDGQQSISFRFSRKSFWGIKHHAIQELNAVSSYDGYLLPSYSKVKLIKKMVSLGFTSGRMFQGIFNGFTAEANFPSNLFNSAPWFEILGTKNPYTCRSIGRSGISIDEYNPILEYSIRRREVDNAIAIVSAEVRPTLYSPRYYAERIKSLEQTKRKEDFFDFVNEFPHWHGIRNYFGIRFGLTEFLGSALVFPPIYPKVVTNNGYTTINLPIPDSSIRVFERSNNQDPIFIGAEVSGAVIFHGSTVVVGDRILITDTSETPKSFVSAMWPAMRWGNSNSNLLSIPPIRNKPRNLGYVRFLPSNTNWAHFMEDILPRVLLQPSHEFIDAPWTSSTSDEMQLELLGLLNATPLIQVGSHSSVNSQRAWLSFHINRRNEIISGVTQEDVLSVDVYLMKQFRKKIGVPVEMISNDKFFVPRESNLLRRLLNRKQVISLFQRHGYQVVSMSDLTLTERIRKFAAASEVVYEHGAAGVVIYFAPGGIDYTQLRHPGISGSNEHFGTIKITNNHWHEISGKRANMLYRLFFGSDAWIVPKKRVMKYLKNH